MSSVASAIRGTPISALPPERSIRQAAPTIVPGCSRRASRHSREESPVVMMSSTISTRAPGAIEKPRLNRNAPSSRSTKIALAPSQRAVS